MESLSNLNKSIFSQSKPDTQQTPLPVLLNLFFFLDFHSFEERHRTQSGNIVFIMRFIILLSVIVGAFGSDVIELTDSSFAGGVDGKDVMLVEFFAPW